MPTELTIATVLIIVITGIVSVLAFTHRALRDKLIFSPQAILADKELHRLVTSAFLHADWQHLAFNMFSLYFFGRIMEPVIGPQRFLLIYFAGIIGGNLLSLYLHRRHEYLALGASGGVCGVIFSSVFLFPGITINFFLLPVGLPGWLYAVLFLGFEFYGGRRQRTNVGHDAHLGGAIVGLLTATALFPAIVRWSPWLYATVMILSAAMLIYFWKNPLNLPPATFLKREAESRAERRESGPSPEEIDAVLDKVSRKGLHSLTAKERRILEKAAKK